MVRWSCLDQLIAAVCWRKDHRLKFNSDRTRPARSPPTHAAVTAFAKRAWRNVTVRAGERRAGGFPPAWSSYVSSCTFHPPTPSVVRSSPVARPNARVHRTRPRAARVVGCKSRACGAVPMTRALGSWFLAASRSPLPVPSETSILVRGRGRRVLAGWRRLRRVAERGERSLHTHAHPSLSLLAMLRSGRRVHHPTPSAARPALRMPPPTRLLVLRRNGARHSVGVESGRSTTVSRRPSPLPP
jgi:hypothetical protein